jgi:hypothetical protein
LVKDAPLALPHRRVLRSVFMHLPSAPSLPRALVVLLAVAAAAVPGTLLWDNAWESTIGIDRVWSPPHVGNYLSVALAALGAILCAGRGLRLGPVRLPLGAWIILWGALAYLGAVFFDRWWQLSYGLAAGIWHPPQLLKAVAFFAIAVGTWQTLSKELIASTLAGGVVLALISVVTLVWTLANRQHSASFYQIAAGAYPIVLVALAATGRARFSATLAACAYTLLIGAAVWLLPLVPGEPLTAPIYNPRTTLLPPPFPLLLIAPAFALDILLGILPARRTGWGAALEAGLAFCLVFGVAQWVFASFLLSPAADGWFFAGGGRHWPFFLKIDPSARTTFWQVPGEEMTSARCLAAVALSVVSARLGLWIATWMNRAPK